MRKTTIKAFTFHRFQEHGVSEVLLIPAPVAFLCVTDPI
jgi:hypothetical protein